MTDVTLDYELRIQGTMAEMDGLHCLLYYEGREVEYWSSKFTPAWRNPPSRNFQIRGNTVLPLSSSVLDTDDPTTIRTNWQLRICHL